MVERQQSVAAGIHHVQTVELGVQHQGQRESRSGIGVAGGHRFGEALRIGDSTPHRQLLALDTHHCVGCLVGGVEQ